MSETKEPQEHQELGRNEPCHCGSGTKYKRCHGVSAAPKLSTPKANPFAGVGAGAAGGMPGGLPFDPSQLDPNFMNQFAQAMQRLPKGQMQRLQAIMQKAMAGKDVTAEAAEFERSLPPQLVQMLSGFKMPGMPGVGEGTGAGLPDIETSAVGPTDMSVEDARAIVEKAMAEGKISQDEASSLLTEHKGGVSKLWR